MTTFFEGGGGARGASNGEQSVDFYWYHFCLDEKQRGKGNNKCLRLPLRLYELLEKQL